MRYNSTSIFVALLIFLAANTCGQIAMGQVTMKFVTNRDAGITGFDTEQMNHGGDSGQLRALKSNQNALIMDFDTAAMGSFLAANPGNAVWTLGIQVKDFIQEIPLAQDVAVLTVESINDWSESNGSQGADNFNWNQAEAAATYFYAQTRYTGTPGAGTLDAANSLEWVDPDSGPYTFTTRAPNYALFGVPTTVGGGNGTTAGVPTPAFTNTQKFGASQLYNDWFDGNVSKIVIDNAIINAMINDVNNRGLRFGPIVNTITSNWRIFDSEQAGGIFAPFLEVAITPSEGLNGDFDGDGRVDGHDFLLWQRDFSVGSLAEWQAHFGETQVSATASAVPEPGAIVLAISACALMAAGRRKSF